MIMCELLVIIGLAFLVMEMFNPIMFFLNFAIAAFITSGVAFLISDINVLMVVFVALSLILLVFLRPILVKTRTTKDQKTGMDAKYVDKLAKVIETVTPTSGAITIYDERWEARSLDGEEIPKDETVKIIKYDSLVMGVKKEGK